MRIAVTGATGNVGSQVVARLLASGQVEEVVGLARRPARDWDERVRWVPCDLSTPDADAALVQAFDGVDAVVHLAWQIQPARDLEQMRRTNVDGSRRVFAAAAASAVPALVHASSVGAYSAGPKDRPVDESWPTEGVPSSSYSRHKAEVERLLDVVEAQHPALRVVRLRPGLVFQARAASEIARYFLGPFVPLSALHRRFLPVLPTFDRLVFQAVHTADVADATVRAVVQDSAWGAYNIAADPVLDAQSLAAALRARPVPVPLTAVRALADITFRLRLQPTDAGWLDLAAAVPVMSTERARTDLGWVPQHSATDALLELLEAMGSGEGGPSPVLRAAGTAGERVKDVLTAVAHGGPGQHD